MMSISLTFTKATLGTSRPNCRYCCPPRDNKAATTNDPTTLPSFPPLKNPLQLLRLPPKKPSRIQQIKPIQTKSTGTKMIATDVLRLMDALQLSVPPHVYASLLKECIDLRDIVRGAEVHAHMNHSGRPLSLPLANRLLLMYARCSHLDSALKLFDKLTVKDSISWTTVIAGHVDNGFHKKALIIFKQMQLSGLELAKLTNLTVIGCALKACIHVNKFGLAMGKQLHGWLLKIGQTNGSNSSGIAGEDLLLGSLLIDFYGKFGCLERAQRVFNQMRRHDTVVWTAMIVGYCKQDHFDKVLELFKEMGRVGKTKKNKFTFSSVLRACGRMRDSGRCGRQVHADAIKFGVESDVFVQSSLVDMYGRSGVVEDARRAFEIVCDNKSSVCWNTMLNVYKCNGLYKEAIQFLYQMKAVGLQPQESMLNEVRMACAGLSDMQWTDHV